MDLLTHNAPYRRIAARWGVAEASLRRHERHHLHSSLVEVKEAQAMLNAEALTAKLLALDAYVARVLARSEQQGDDRLVLMGVREGRANVDSLFHISSLTDIEKRLQALEQGDQGKEGGDDADPDAL